MLFSCFKPVPLGDVLVSQVDGGLSDGGCPALEYDRDSRG